MGWSSPAMVGVLQCHVSVAYRAGVVLIGLLILQAREYLLVDYQVVRNVVLATYHRYELASKGKHADENL